MMRNKEIASLSSHFSKYLRPVIYEGKKHAECSFRIRHNVYCEELAFEEENPQCLENDEFDQHSIHCLIQHKASSEYAGTVRLVTTSSPDQKLPIEVYCSSAIDNSELFPSNFERHDICEISKLAVPSQFRRRERDRFRGAATGAIGETNYSENELRCFPFIAVGLYLSATSVLIRKNINHGFIMIEPRLARSMKFVGLPLEQIGPAIDYQGKTAPFHINPIAVPKHLKQSFKFLLYDIDSEIADQLATS